MLRSLANFASRDPSMDPPAPFPLYLLPSAPFPWRRRSNSSSSLASCSPEAHLRRQSDASTLTTASTSSHFSRNPVNTRPKRLRYPSISPEEDEGDLNDHTQYLRCASCHSDLCFATSIISKGFMGRHGRAYLLSSLPASQINLSPPSSRPLVTGVHTVSDVSCKLCENVLGWKYIDAEQERQKYKVGKFILEREKVIRVNSWGAPGLESDSDEEAAMGRTGCGKGWEGAMEREIRDIMESEDVDLSDEEALEEMFSGVMKPVGTCR